MGIVIGFDVAGPIKVLDTKMTDNLVKHSPGELLYMVNQDFEQVKMDAAQAKLKALTAADDAEKAEQHADALIADAGLNKQTVLELVIQVKGVEIDPVEHLALLSRVEGEWVEMVLSVPSVYVDPPYSVGHREVSQRP
jgi:hypothetical protein